MPYNGIPKSKTKLMEKCVSDVMDQGHDKSSAIAICHKSIMGKIDMNKSVWTTATINNFPDSSFAYVESGKKDKEGKTVPRSKRHLPYKDGSGKIDPAHVRNALARLSQTNISASAKASAHTKLVAAAKQIGIDVNTKVDSMKGGENMTKKTVSKISDEELEKMAEKAVADAKTAFKDCIKQNMKDGMSATDAMKECKTGKAEEAESLDDSEEETEEAAPEVKEEEAVEEEKPAEEVVAEEKVEETEEAKEEEVVAETEEAEEKPAKEVVAGDKITDLVKQVLDKVAAMEATLKKQDEPEEPASPQGEESASTEGATSTPEGEEAAPEGGVEETSIEDKAPEGASPEGAEDVSKVYAVISKVPGQIEKLEKSLNEKLEALEDRINKIEEQPAPSKVVSSQVVTKGGGSVNPNQAELDVINKELSELEEMKKSDLSKFQKERKWERALDLIEKRNQLQRTEA